MSTITKLAFCMGNFCAETYWHAEEDEENLHNENSHLSDTLLSYEKYLHKAIKLLKEHRIRSNYDEYYFQTAEESC